MVDGTNMIGLVVYSLVFGFAFACIGKEAMANKPILGFFSSVTKVKAIK